MKKKGWHRKPKLSQQILEVLGMGPDPPNSRWVDLKKQAGDAGEVSGGQVLVSIELLPKRAAEHLFPAGMGRGEPNQHPKLEPPKGRFNPAYVSIAFPVFLSEAVDQ